MIERDGDSYCGLYCGACDIRLAGETGRKSRFAAFWDERTLRRFRERQGTPITDPSQLRVRCRGCKSDDVFVNCGACPLRACARDRKVEHCSDCAEYPCPIYDAFRKAGAILPHTATCAANLAAIGRVGVERWAAEEQARWRCPECRAPFSWYADACGACGTDLRDRTYRFTWLRALGMRLGMALLMRTPLARARVRRPADP